MKTITVQDFEANRLTFARKDGRSPHRWVYDARGYQFVHYPATGDILKEPRDSTMSHIDTGILFDAYDDGDSSYFAFYHEDCFDPPMKLIVARSWEDAYGIFLDEFADIPEESEIEEYIMDKVYEYIKANVEFNPTQTTPKEVYENGTAAEKQAWREAGENAFGDDGVMCVAPNGARDTNGSPYRRSKNIQGFELELIKAEKIESNS